MTATAAELRGRCRARKMMRRKMTRHVTCAAVQGAWARRGCEACLESGAVGELSYGAYVRDVGADLVLCVYCRVERWASN